MTAGDRADGIGHREQRQAEGEGDAEVADLVAGDDRGADAAEDKHERADELCACSLQGHLAPPLLGKWFAGKDSTARDGLLRRA